MKKALKRTEQLALDRKANIARLSKPRYRVDDIWLCEELGQLVAKPLGDELRDELRGQVLYRIYYWEKTDVFRTGKRSLFMEPSVFERARACQREEPLFLFNWFDLKFWWYRDEFWESTVYSDEEVKLLLWEKGRREQRKFERLAKAKAAAKEALEEARRERIPEEVRLLVWERDGGRCVKCGSTEDLEFDHIIPVSKGGSSTEKNVQLLCAKCNREKGDRIA